MRNEEEIQLDPSRVEQLQANADEDFLAGATCNTNEPEECESCQ
jgi:hypothetical protein